MSILQESIKLVDAKMHQTFLYLNDLLKQLAVLKPTNPTVYSIPGVGDFQNLGFVRVVHQLPQEEDRRQGLL